MKTAAIAMLLFIGSFIAIGMFAALREIVGLIL